MDHIATPRTRKITSESISWDLTHTYIHTNINTCMHVHMHGSVHVCMYVQLNPIKTGSHGDTSKWSQLRDGRFNET